METTALESEILQLLAGKHHDPFHLLGAHPVEVQGKPAVAVRAFLPEAVKAVVVADFRNQPMTMVHEAGFFEAVFKGYDQLFRYTLRLEDAQGNSWEVHDPYSFWPALTDYDLYLFGEGTHLQAYEKMGAHIREFGGVAGVLFAVWAPNAARVSVIGDFNVWNDLRHPMRSRPNSGIWELFIPGLTQGEKYKFSVRSRAGGHVVQKADPFAFYSELRPRTASIVYDIDQYAWGDDGWIKSRHEHEALNRPISVYEVHLGSWKRNIDNSWLSYRQMADDLVRYVKEMGFTHVELLPISEHPFDGSWGYQTTGYFSVTSRYGTPTDFQYFVDTCHRNGIGVILDWVPAHFPMDDHGLRFFDGTYLYEHEDPRMGQHQDWGTAIFNFGRTEVRNFLISNALFWLAKYHVDGLRVDAVASMLYLDYSRKPGEWIPNRYGGNHNLEAISFIKDLNRFVHGMHRDILTIAEESTAWPGVSLPVHLGGIGFTLKWNMGWMHDILSYFSKDPIYRKFHHYNLTFALMYAFTENFMLVFSHDEVVHMKGSMIRKMPGDYWQKFANLRALYSLMFAFPGKKLLFMGNEIGQFEEWNHDSSLDWHLLDFDAHRKLQSCIRDLNRIYGEMPQLHTIDFHHDGFEWIDFADSDNSIISFIRKCPDQEDPLVVLGNFTPVAREAYRVGVPRRGPYRVVFNSDQDIYGGSNTNDTGRLVVAEDFACQGRPYSIVMTLPGLSVLYLRREPEFHT